MARPRKLTAGPPPGVTMPDEDSTDRVREQELRQVCAELSGRLRAGQPGSAEAVLEQHPWIAEDVEGVLEVLYTEFTTREELGLRPTPDEFYERFPRWCDDFRVQLEFHDLLNAGAPRPGGVPRKAAETQFPPRAAGEGDGPPAAPPRVLGSYVLVDEIGRGSMGVVYRAQHRTLPRTAAVKMVLAGEHAGPADQERFAVEAQAVARLQHPNIVQIYEVGQDGTHPYLVLEYVDGGSLAERLHGEPLPPGTAAELVRTLARAMHYAHQRGIVHRDLKPANVLLQSASPGPPREAPDNADSSAQSASRALQAATPKITDFGLAKQLDQPGGDTASGAVFGTPSYMAPEQAAGAGGRIGPAADIYALGAVLYELLTGRPPFRADNLWRTLTQVVGEEAVSPSSIQPGVPRDLATVCLKCLQKEPRRRYADAAQLADDLERFLAGAPIHARPVGPVERTCKWARRHPSTAALLVCLATAVLTLLAGSLWYNGQLQVAAEDAGRKAVEAQRAAEDADRERGEALKYAKLARDKEADAVLAARRLRDQLEAQRRDLYTLQLTRVEEVWRTDPDRALRLLEDAKHCPHDLRDFAWRLYHRLSTRDRQLVSGHTAGVQAVAFAADGNTLVTAGKQDRMVRLWDVGTGEARSFRNYGRQVAALAFAPDGRTLAFAGADHSLRLWDTLTDKEVLLPKPPDGVGRLVFSRDGRLLAGAGRDGLIRVWDVNSRREAAAWSETGGPVQVLAFGASGETVAALGADRTLRVWNLTNRKERTPSRLPGTGAVTLAVFTAGADRLAVYSADGTTLEVWDVREPVARKTFDCADEPASAVAFAPDGQSLAVAGEDGSIKLFDAATGRHRLTLRGNTGPVRCLAFTSDSQRLACAGDDGAVRLWGLGQRADRDPAREWGVKIVASTFSADGRVLIAGTEWGLLKVCDAQTLEELATLDGSKAGPLGGLALAADSRTLAAVFHPGPIKVWDLKTRAEIAHLTGHRQRVNAVAITADARTVATGSDDGTAKLWDVAARQEVRTLRADGVAILCVTFAPDGRTLATGSADGAVRLWDSSTGREIFQLAGHRKRVLAVAFSPDGQTLATGGEEDGVRLWAVGKRLERHILAGHLGCVVSLAFTPDGTTLAVGTVSRPGSKLPCEVRLWDVETGHFRARLAGQGGPVALAPSGRILATHSNNRVLLLHADP